MLNPSPSLKGATGVTRDSVHYDESDRKLNKHVFKCVRSSVSEREENCCLFCNSLGFYSSRVFKESVSVYCVNRV